MSEHAKEALASAPATPDQAKAPSRRIANSPDAGARPASPAGQPADNGLLVELLRTREQLEGAVQISAGLQVQLAASSQRISVLHQELHQRCAVYEHNLTALERHHTAAAQASDALVAALSADNQRQAGQLEQLQRYVEALEAQAQEWRAKEQPAPGDEAQSRIDALQLELVGQQREAALARREWAQAEEVRDAVHHQAEMLRLQVEQMAERLDAEREENARLQAGMATLMLQQ